MATVLLPLPAVSADRNQQRKEKRLAALARGFCGQCAIRECVPGKKRCQVCIDRAAKAPKRCRCGAGRAGECPACETRQKTACTAYRMRGMERRSQWRTDDIVTVDDWEELNGLL